MAAYGISVLEAVKTLVAGIDGTGSYTYDLSGAGAVLRGHNKGSPPRVSIVMQPARLENGVALANVDVHLPVLVVASVPVDGAEYPDREDALLNIVNDLRLALTTTAIQAQLVADGAGDNVIRVDEWQVSQNLGGDDQRHHITAAVSLTIVYRIARTGGI